MVEHHKKIFAVSSASLPVLGSGQISENGYLFDLHFHSIKIL
ncbi:MAG: hypothetical protein N2234_00185 [Planctomycetota bacterium]|nr:hypothetical protein [Planctomycetota bacterium]